MYLLDPMHIFKNVGKSLWKHMIGYKDSVNAHLDLKKMGTKLAYWPKHRGTFQKLYSPKAPKIEQI